MDKDGDLDMDSALGIRGRGRGPNNRRDAPRAASHGSTTHGQPYPSRDTRPTRVDPASVHKAILRTMGSKDSAPKGPRALSRLTRHAGKVDKEDGVTGGLDQIKIYGLKESKAASNPGGGVKDLLIFLERKATAPNAPSKEAVRIRKVCLTSQSAGSHRQRSLALSGPLSFHAKLSERRPRYTSHAASDINGTCNFKVICLANVV